MAKFKCECGKEFDDGQIFNSHKSSCKVHFSAKYGNDDAWNKLQKAKGQKLHDYYAKKAEEKAAIDLKKWLLEKHTCEKCGKVMTEKFGSGRFCSRACANSKSRTAEQRAAISAGLKKVSKGYCQFCGQAYNTKLSLSTHERTCSLNPNRQANAGGVKNHELKQKRLVKVEDYTTRRMVQLNITYKELADYRAEHKYCEICGKPVESLASKTSKVKYKNLCIDHNHTNNTFRGLLCNTCNRNLGWFENNQETIKEYLNKNNS